MLATFFTENDDFDEKYGFGNVLGWSFSQNHLVTLGLSTSRNYICMYLGGKPNFSWKLRQRLKFSYAYNAYF
jgi:hypothetical protein